MSNHDSRLWQQLRNGGLVQGNLPADLQLQPLYLRLFLGGMTWLAAQLFLLAVLSFFSLFMFMLRSDMELPLALGGTLLLCLSACALLTHIRPPSSGNWPCLGRVAG